MKVALDVVSPTRRKIRVELPAEVVNREFLRVYDTLSQRARIKGFRPGKAPPSVLKGLYRDEVRGQVLARLVEDSLGEVFKERGLEVVSRPEVEADDLEEGSPFTFSAVVEVKPEIEVKNYLGLELKKVKLSIDEAQVEQALERLRESYAHLEPVEDRDVVEAGDFVILDFVGSIDGKPLPGGKAENYQLEVGKGNALPEFEKAIVGLKKDGEHTIRVAYPEDYFNRELAAKAVVFSVTIREIKKKILPPLDDEFAKDYGECASLDELRQKIRKRLEGELEQMQRRDLKEQILSRLIDAHPFEVPPGMLERQIRHLMERHQSRLSAQDPASSEQKPSTEEIRNELEPHAQRQLRAMLLVEKIAALENVVVSDQEIYERTERIARAAGDKAMAVRDLYRRDDARQDLRAEMVFDRTLDFLLERAKVKETEPPVDAQGKKR